MENEEGASPQEQLAAEVANDTSETGEVTQDDVAEVLNLPKTGDKGNADDKGGEGSDDEDGSDDDADDAADADAGGDGSDDSDDDDEEAEEEQETETADVEDKQFVLKVTDANGKEFTISPDDDIEKILEDFEPKTNGQIFKILRDLQKLETEKEQYESEQETQAQETARLEKVNSIRAGWDTEIKTLQGEKRIPVQADGSTPPRVKEVLAFMRETNDKRLQNGQPLIQSFEDALDKLELKESKDDAVKKNKEEKELARKRGAVVGGSSAAQTNGVSNYKRGARTATEALRQMGILR